jgi:hypothetical protein
MLICHFCIISLLLARRSGELARYLGDCWNIFPSKGALKVPQICYFHFNIMTYLFRARIVKLAVTSFYRGGDYDEEQLRLRVFWTER